MRGYVDSVPQATFGPLVDDKNNLFYNICFLNRVFKQDVLSGAIQANVLESMASTMSNVGTVIVTTRRISFTYFSHEQTITS